MFQGMELVHENGFHLLGALVMAGQLAQLVKVFAQRLPRFELLLDAHHGQHFGIYTVVLAL